MKKEVIKLIVSNAIAEGFEPAMCLSIFHVETGGEGYDSTTGKILIQFEPAWFRKLNPYAPSGKWSVNKIERQAKEWIAFNDAYAKDPINAMMSTSIGLPQILGLHYKRLGFKTVGDFYDFMKASLANQVKALFMFIKTDKTLLAAVKNKNYHMIAYKYNGEKYKELAAKIGREPYNISLDNSRMYWLKYLSANKL